MCERDRDRDRGRDREIEGGREREREREEIRWLHILKKTFSTYLYSSYCKL